jgi:PAS domain S-box-containing protein
MTAPRISWATPARATLVYAAVAGCWIILSDWLTVRALGPSGLAELSPAKGLFFVAVTSLVLFLVMRAREQVVSTEAERRRAAEEQYRRIFDRSFAGILVLDAETGRVLDANPAAERLYGHARSDLLARRLHDVCTQPPDIVDAALGEAAADRQSTFNSHHRTASGAIIQLEIVTSAMEFGDRRAVVAILHDVTTRTEAEELLRTSEARYRGLLERASEPIVILDEKFFVVEANERARQLLGYEGERLRGMHARDLVTPGQLERQPIRIAELATGRTVLSERVLQRSDGGEVQVEMSSRRLPDGQYEIILRDVTERRRHEEARRQTQKLESLGQLAGGIAHDLNNVLNVVLANAALVRTSLEGRNGDPAADLRELEQSAQRGVEMVRKLLSFGRAAPLAVRPLDAARVVRELMPTLHRLLPATVQVVCDADGPVAMLADPGAIEQMVVNLATNARDAMPRGGRVTIRVQPPEAPGALATIEVTDEGVGMDAGTRQRIFEPFYTTKGVGHGTGLGLTVVYGLVTQQAGIITVESAPGQGTTVRIGLPSTDAALRHYPTPQDDEFSRWPRGTETILVVEDEAALRSSAARILARLGYAVRTAENGAVGLLAWEAEREGIRLVLSDVVMPAMGGRALYEAIRRQAPAAKFLFMSGYGRDDLDGFDDAYGNGPRVLPKPWTAGELARAVRETLDGV